MRSFSSSKRWWSCQESFATQEAERVPALESTRACGPAGGACLPEMGAQPRAYDALSDVQKANASASADSIKPSCRLVQHARCLADLHPFRPVVGTPAEAFRVAIQSTNRCNARPVTQLIFLEGPAAESF